MKNMKLILAATALVGTSFTAGQMLAPTATTAEPGSSGDPAVTESYMNQELGKLKTEIKSLTTTVNSLKTEVTTLQGKVTNLESNSGNTGTTTPPTTTTPPATDNDTTNSIGTGIVNCTTLNMRSGAGTSYAKVGTLVKGNKVTLLKKSGSWYQVKYGTLTGWVSGDYLTVTLNNSSTGSTTPTTKTGVVNCVSLNIRSGAGTNYGIVAKAAKGATVTILKTSGSWTQVKYGTVTGWVSSTYITVK